MVRRWGPTVLAAVSYYLGARLGTVLEIPGTNAGLFWPPVGIATALMMTYGYRIGLGIMVGSAAALLPSVGSFGLARGLGVVCGEVAADVVPLLVAVRFLNRSLRGRAPFARPHELVRFVLWAGVGASALSATMGVASLTIGGKLSLAALPMIWAHWSTSNVVSVLLIAPALCVWLGKRPQLASTREVLTFVGVLGTALVGTLLVFLEPSARGPHHTFEYVTIFFVACAPFAVGLHGSTAVSLVVGAIAVFATAAGRGPFVASSPDRSMLLLSIYLGIVALVGLLFSSLLSERRLVEDEQKKLQAHLARSHKIESLGRLAGGVAHDLNNLLVPILGYAQILVRDAAPGTVLREGLEQINEAGERARDLTKQLLAFGRKQVLNFRVIDLGEAIGRFEKLLRRTLREDIRFELIVPPKLGKVRADVGQLEQVLMNLAVNAQQAMPGGGALVVELSNVRLEAKSAEENPEVAPGEYVLLRVADTGKGMEKAVLDRAFEPFFTTKPVGEGTGLGLSIVHGIILQHDGFVRVESAVGRGVSFFIYLPRVDSEASHEEPATAAKDSIAPGGQTILLAEDDAGVRDIVTRMLEMQGYRVLVGNDVASCLRIAADEGEALSLLLTDVVMPEIDGKQLYLKLAEHRPGLAVLYMSGHGGDVLTDRGVAEEAAQFIAKPVTAEALGQAVRRALSRARPS